jgi:hypothetical protein
MIRLRSDYFLADRSSFCLRLSAKIEPPIGSVPSIEEGSGTEVGLTNIVVPVTCAALATRIWSIPIASPELFKELENSTLSNKVVGVSPTYPKKNLELFWPPEKVGTITDSTGLPLRVKIIVRTLLLSPKSVPK